MTFPDRWGPGIPGNSMEFYGMGEALPGIPGLEFWDVGISSWKS